MKGFFAIERRLWPWICGLGMNPAVSYLVQACGTGRDNTTTGWSVNAIERYTNISRPNARQAVNTLVTHKVEIRTREGARPEYRLASWAELYPILITDRVELYIYDKVVRGERLHDFEYEESALWRDGLIINRDGRYETSPPDEPVYIWLPNSIVTSASGETSPIERIRQTQDVMILRLFVELYHEHDLRDCSGVRRDLLWQPYDRTLVGRYGEYNVWSFKPGPSWVYPARIVLCHWRSLTKQQEKAGHTGYELFWNRLSCLQDLHLLEFVPHLVEGGPSGGEIIHPYGCGGGDSVEDRLGRAARAAALAALSEMKRSDAEDSGLLLAPVPRHFANVQMIGIARLRYRPHTKATGEWWAKLNSKGEAYIRKYQELVARTRGRGMAGTGTY